MIRHESSSAQSNRIFELEHQVSTLEHALLEACKALGSGAPEETARVYKEFAALGEAK